MRDLTISVDLDSTLVDIIEPWLDHINKKLGTSYQLDDVKSYSQDFLMEGFDFIETEFYDTLEPIKGAIEFIKELQQDYFVQIVTHTFDGHKESKMRFIERFFGDIKVICTDDCKLEGARGTVLIDDKLEHIEKHRDINKDFGIVYSMNNQLNYNRTDRYDILRLGSYKDILTAIDSHYTNRNILQI